MRGVDEVEQRITELADRIWSGEEALRELHQILRDNQGSPPGPTKVAELTDYYYRSEHISRIAHGHVRLKLKERRRKAPVAAES